MDLGLVFAGIIIFFFVISFLNQKVQKQRSFEQNIKAVDRPVQQGEEKSREKEERETISKRPEIRRHDQGEKADKLPPVSQKAHELHGMMSEKEAFKKNYLMQELLLPPRSRRPHPSYRKETGSK